MDRLKKMNLYCRVVELGSFAQAAKDAGISPAIVGRHIGDLEQYLGIRLINRTTRSMEVTEEGQEYYQGCREILDNVSALENHITYDSESTLAGLIRISAPEGLGSPVLLDVIEVFQKQYPQVAFDLVLDNSASNLVSDQIDIAIRLASELSDSTMIVRKIADSHLSLYASADYLARMGLPKSLQDLAHHDCIHFGASRYGDLWPYQVGGKIRKVRLNWKLVLNHTQSHLDAIKRGWGIGMIPDLLAERLVREGQLVRIEVREQLLSLGIFALYQSKTLLPKRVSLFLKHLASSFDELAGDRRQ